VDLRALAAAQALTGRKLTLVRERSKVLSLWDGQQGMLTVHPSSILRMPDETTRHEAFASFVSDLSTRPKSQSNSPPI
jgi:DNA polymerase